MSPITKAQDRHNHQEYKGKASGKQMGQTADKARDSLPRLMPPLRTTQDPHVWQLRHYLAFVDRKCQGFESGKIASVLLEEARLCVDPHLTALGSSCHPPADSR